MFKKIIFVLIFSIIPTTANAQENYNNIDWINFDWDKVIPDQYTINLAKMYTKIDNGILNSNSITYLNFSKNFDSSKIKNISKHYEESAKYFSVETLTAFINDQNAGVFTTNFLQNVGLNAEPWQNWCNPQNQNMCGGAYHKQKNMSSAQSYLYINTNDELSYKESGFVIHHESSHLYIFDITQRASSNYLGPDFEFNCWIVEGAANALGNSSFLMIEDNDLIRNRIIKSIKYSIPKINFMTKNELINYFKNNQNNKNFCNGTGGAYSVGMLLMEYLYINYDFNSVNNFLITVEKKSNQYWSNNQKASQNIFNDSLVQAFGINENMFYSEAFDYVIKSYNRVLTS